MKFILNALFYGAICFLSVKLGFVSLTLDSFQTQFAIVFTAFQAGLNMVPTLAFTDYANAYTEVK